MKAQETTTYFLFIDECGDQNLENYNPIFPIFTLCGILVREDKLSLLTEKINKLKEQIWGSKEVIIHSRDIRRCKNDFLILHENPEVKQQFYKEIDDILGQDDVYVIVACTILKEPFIKHFSKGEDVYGLSLSYLIERSVFCVDDECENGEIHIVVEKRGRKEDKKLVSFYDELRITGTKWVSSKRLQDRVRTFTSKAKKDNIIGLQIADMVAYPIACKVLRPNTPNPAFDIIKKNIYSDKGLMLGYKVIPH